MSITNGASKRRAGMLVACAAILGGTMFAAAPAQAWWRGGVWIGVPPVVVGAPAYYPPYYYPPAYYPPYGYYPPPAYPYPAGPQSVPAPQTQSQTTTTTQTNTQVAYGSTCYAGVYVCPAPGSTAIGAGCACPGLGAPSYGVVR
jgi:hypothetical protein